MGKIKKDTTKYLKSCNSLKIFKYEKSNKYYSCFYVGSNASSSGNKIQSLKTENINDAMKKAKENYHKWFELNYRNNQSLTNALEDLVENLRLDNKTDNTISKYTTVLSNMFNYAIKNGVIKSKPDFPKLKIVNNARPSYFNNELNQISKRLFEEYKKTTDTFYLETKTPINLSSLFYKEYLSRNCK